MASPAQTSASTRRPPTYRQRWLVLAVACIAQLMVVLDATVVNIALPSAQRELAFSDASRQWVVSGYALAFGSLLLLGGRLAGRIGYRRAFLIGMVGFAAASALGGAAGSLGMLVTARVLQGVFAALLAPAALSLVTTTFTDGPERSRAFGVYGAVATAGGGIGLLLGGVLTQQLDWRWCLLVNIFFAVLAVAGALATREPVRSGRPPAIDLPGAVLITGGLFVFVLGLADAETRGWGDASSWGAMTAGALLVAGFVAVQRRSAHPLLPLRILVDGDRLGGYVTLLTASVAMFGLFLFLTYYLQQTLGYGPVVNGLAYLPMIIVTTLFSTFLTRRLLGRFGARSVIPSGMLVAAVGLLLLTRLGPDSGYVADVLPGLLLFGSGLGLAITPAVDLGTARTGGDDAGTASALVNTAQQVGGSIGIAALSTLSAAVTAASRPVGRPPRWPATRPATSGPP